MNRLIWEGSQHQEKSPKPPSPQENISQVQVTSHVQTIEENAKFLTPKEIAQANVAKWLLHMLGYPLVVDLKTIIKTNVIWDNPVTESNLKLMECLLGHNTTTIKGKSTRITNYVMPNVMYASILTCMSMVCLS